MSNAKAVLLALAEQNIAELTAENEKLRNERDHWHVEQVHAFGNWEDAHKRVIELEAENSKLREEIELVGTAGYLLAMKQFKAENAKLRDDLETQREVAAHNTNRNAREYKRVRDENDKLRELVNSYADSFEKDAAMNNGCGPYYSGEDWLALANDMRIELAECCGELGIEVHE